MATNFGDAAMNLSSLRCLGILTVATAFLLLAGELHAGLRHRHGPVYAPDCGPQVHYSGRPCCGPAIQQTLVVCHPSSGCQIPIDVCLPACCTDAPLVCSRGTLIGCGLTRFRWCCGYEITVRYQKCGDVRVIYD
jgi:hypothetical protein